MQQVGMIQIQLQIQIQIKSRWSPQRTSYQSPFKHVGMMNADVDTSEWLTIQNQPFNCQSISIRKVILETTFIHDTEFNLLRVTFVIFIFLQSASLGLDVWASNQKWGQKCNIFAPFLVRLFAILWFPLQSGKYGIFAH